MKLLWRGILAWAMLGVPVANANVWSPMTDLEVKQLPNYCMVKYREQRGDTGARGEGMALLGPQYSNVHHYCGGLNYLNRYYKNMGRRDAGSYLAFAINEFTYMVDHMVPQSPIGAEIFLNRGIAYSLAKNDAKAMGDLQRALSLDPKLARAYISIADQYAKQKNNKKALDVVTEGLRHVPDNRALKRRYGELGGKQPYPEPAVANQPLVPAETKSQAKAEASTATQQAGAPEAVADEASPKAAEAQRAAPPQIGSPNNPYCRFCPD
jgi:tetratricopeptide (TPR) repeat protein